MKGRVDLYLAGRAREEEEMAERASEYIVDTAIVLYIYYRQIMLA